MELSLILLILSWIFFLVYLAYEKKDSNVLSSYDPLQSEINE